MTSFVIENKTDVYTLYASLLSGDFPVTVSVCKGRKRSTKQNRLQRLWMNQIADELGDTPEEWRGFCKLTFGVPILKESSEAFAMEYDLIFEALPYHTKVKFMMEPFSFAITRKMTTAQKADYLDRICRHFSNQGVILAQPEEPNHGQDREPGRD